ncbi:hypothetical protein ACNKHN_22250 [Shigella flexneri]
MTALAHVLIGLWIGSGSVFVNLDATDGAGLANRLRFCAEAVLAGLDHEDMAEDMTPLYQAIVRPRSCAGH